jgi:hypothetical protein
MPLSPQAGRVLLFAVGGAKVYYGVSRGLGCTANLLHHELLSGVQFESVSALEIRSHQRVRGLQRSYISLRQLAVPDGDTKRRRGRDVFVSLQNDDALPILLSALPTVSAPSCHAGRGDIFTVTTLMP